MRNSEVSSECKTHSRQLSSIQANVSTNRKEYIATNDLTKFSVDAVEFESQTRWKVEEFHREIKQLTGIEFCQCRRAPNSEKSYSLCYVSLELFKKIRNENRKNY